jgi:hypothetical protein
VRVGTHNVIFSQRRGSKTRCLIGDYTIHIFGEEDMEERKYIKKPMKVRIGKSTNNSQWHGCSLTHLVLDKIRLEKIR